MKKLMIAAILLSTSFMVYSQKKEKKEKVVKPEKEIVSYKHSFGLGAGFTTGVGLSYRFVPKKYGFQINVGPMYSNYGDNINASFGLTLLDKLYEGKWCNMYLYLGNHLVYHRDKLSSYDYALNVNTQEIYETKKLNTGIGLGWEFYTQSSVVLNLMVGYAQYNNFEKLLPTAEVALYYRFGRK